MVDFPELSWQLLHIALSGGLLLGLGALAAKFCKEPADRIRVIEWTFCGCLLLAVLQFCEWLPTVKLGLLPARTSQEPSPKSEAPAQLTSDFEISTEPIALPREIMSPAEKNLTADAPSVSLNENVSIPSSPSQFPISDSQETTEAAIASPAWSWPVWVLGAYALGVVMLAVRLGWGFVLRGRLSNQVRPAPGKVVRLFHSLEQIRGREKLAARVRLAVSERITSPVTWGLFRPVIVVPASWLEESSGQLRCGLAHEWSHIDRRDFRAAYLAAFVEILFYYQPLFWLLKRRLQLSQDQLADSLAQTESESTATYAQLLITLARREPAVLVPGAMGILSGYSRLYWRIHMLLTTTQPLRRHSRSSFTFLVVLCALFLSAGLSALNLQSAPAQETKEEKQPAEQPKPTGRNAETNLEPYTYKGQVLDRLTNKPIEGVEVEIELSLTRDPKTSKGGNTKLRTITAKTDAEGKYEFTITGDEHAQSSLYIVVDAHHPKYAPKGRSGYAHSMIQKNMRLGEPPFFSEIKLWPGEPIEGTVVDPTGQPLADVEILTYTQSDHAKEGFPRGSFGKAATDKEGRFRIVVATPGDGVLWITPDNYCPQAHRIKDKRGDWGKLVMVQGANVKGAIRDARGNPVPSVSFDVRRRGDGEEADEFLGQNAVANHIGRKGTTDPNGEFQLASLPSGEYRLRVETVDSKTRQPIPDAPVFVEKSFSIPEDQEKVEVAVQAVPHVLIQGQVLDSQGQPSSGHEIHVFGRFGGGFYFGQSNDPGKDGKLEARVPHGLEKVQINLMTNEHGVLRWRLSPEGPLKNGRRIELDRLEEDLTTLEIVRYVAPILMVKAVDEQGQLVPDCKPKALYEKDSPKDPNSRFISGVNGDVNFEKQPDGRWRSNQLIPDQKLTLTIEKEGWETTPETLSLEEKAEKEIVFVLKKKAD